MAKKQIITFLGLTFGLTYLLNFLGFKFYGSIDGSPNIKWGDLLALQMLIPATCAFVTMMIFKQKFNRITKILLGIFLFMTLWVLVKLFFDPVLFSQTQAGITISITLSTLGLQVVGFLGAVFVIIANIKKNWRGQLEEYKLSFGENKKFYLITMAILVGTLTLSGFLNYYFNLGSAAIRFDPKLYLFAGVSALVLAPLTNWAYFLGEEYGWRVFLQDRLLPILGNRKGVLALGVIWGLWHAPIISLGYNYPGQPVLGVISMCLFTIFLGILYSYAVIKTKSVWPAVWLHLATNNLVGLTYVYLSQPHDPIFSFGIGLYGLILLAAVMGGLMFKAKEYRINK